MSLRQPVARLLTAMLLTLTLGALVGYDGVAAADAGQRVPLARQVNRDCFTGGQTTPTTNGAAIIRVTDDGALQATVSLKNALPNTTYNVRLIQVPSGADCGTRDGTLTTNAQGNGTLTLQEPLLPGTTGAFVVLNAVGFTAERDYYTTVNVTLGK